MNGNRLFVACVILSLVAIVGLSIFGPPAVFTPNESAYERATVIIYDERGTSVDTFDVRVADTWRTRAIGLSTTDSLSAGEGMLFVHPEPGERTYSNRGMTFPIDILFIDEDGSITDIDHAAPVGYSWPTTYTGYGKYVLEVQANSTAAAGIEVGYSVEIR